MQASPTILPSGLTRIQSFRTCDVFVQRGVTRRALLAMSLPDDYSLSDARSLCVRGVEELREFVS